MALMDSFGPDDILGAALSTGLFLTGEDGLQLTTIGALAGAVVMIEGRIVTPDGKIVAFAERHVPNSNYTTKTTQHALAEGVLVNVQLRVSTGTATRGHCFAFLELSRGASSTPQALGTLLQGYLTSGARLAWPGSPLESSVAGVGRIRSITGTNPAAGAQISETVPAGVRWRLVAFMATLVASAVVANRRPYLTFDDGATAYLRIPQPGVLAASQTGVFSWTTTGSGDGNNIAAELAPLPITPMLSAGHRISTTIISGDAGDDWGAPQYVVEEWIEG